MNNPILTIGPFTISIAKHGGYWIYRKDQEDHQEGALLSDKEFQLIFEKFWETHL